MSQAITEKTLLPIGLVAVVLVFIMSGVLWLSEWVHLTQANAQQVHSIATKQDKYADDIGAIKTDIALIRQAVGDRRGK